MIGIDKLHHVMYTLALALAGAFLFGAVWGIAVAFVIGAAKEVYWDGYLGRGQADWWDMAANLVGLLIAWVLLVRAGI